MACQKYLARKHMSHFHRDDLKISFKASFSKDDFAEQVETVLLKNKCLYIWIFFCGLTKKSELPSPITRTLTILL